MGRAHSVSHATKNLFPFDLIDTDDPERVEFGEFVQAICTYCLFETREVLQCECGSTLYYSAAESNGALPLTCVADSPMKVCFFIYDRDKNGYVAQDELQFFISALHNGKIAGNTQRESSANCLIARRRQASDHCTLLFILFS